MLCLVVAGLSFVAWPIAEAAVSASVLARQAAWLSGSVAFGLWRALVAAVDGLVRAFAAPRAAPRALATRRGR